MKKLLIFLLVIFERSICWSQTENYTIAVNNFQANYNDGKYEEIFNSFSLEMQQSLPLEVTVQFLKGLKMQTGNMESKEFVEYQKETYAVYKTKFEKSVLAVNISVDGDNKINGLFIRPFEEPDQSASHIVNALSTYPKEIAEMIYSKAKDFPDQTQFSIAIVQNGETKYYGIKKVKNSIKPVQNQDKIFEIGSITKVFASTVLASLVTENKVRLTDQVNIFYPFDFKENISLTYESLANHTSGLPRLPSNLDLSSTSNPYKNYGSRELEEYLKNHLKLETPNVYSYSNLGAGLLGYTLGLSQKSSFHELLQKKVFDKYDMRSSFTILEKSGKKRLVKGLNAEGKVVSNWNFDVLFAAGGILSTTEDLAKFAQAQFNAENSELALTRKPTAVVSDQMQIGLGWHILNQGNDKELIWHNGGTGGYTSSMAIDLENKTAVMILTNVSAMNPKMKNIDQLCFELIKAIDKK